MEGSKWRVLSAVPQATIFENNLVLQATIFEKKCCPAGNDFRKNAVLQATIERERVSG